MADALACDAALRQDARFGYLVAMFRLGERAEFSAALNRFLQDAADPRDVRRARLLGAFASDLSPPDPGDALRLELWRDRLDAGAATRAGARWPGGLPDDVRRAHQALHAAPTRSPWLAGALSALLPGLGQAITGSWQSAVVALAVNALFIGAAADLFAHRLWVVGAAAAAVASVTYVGNVINAAEAAALFNESRRREAEASLERALFPELFPVSSPPGQDPR